MANMLDCDIAISKFKLQSGYSFEYSILNQYPSELYEPSYLPATGWIVQLRFYKDSFDIK